MVLSQAAASSSSFECFAVRFIGIWYGLFSFLFGPSHFFLTSKVFQTTDFLLFVVLGLLVAPSSHAEKTLGIVYTKISCLLYDHHPLW